MTNVRSLIFVCLVSSFAGTARGQWSQYSGGYAGTINALAVSGSNVFAGTFGGVFRSTNNGTTWTACNAGLTNYGVKSLTLSGTTLFAGTTKWWRW